MTFVALLVTLAVGIVISSLAAETLKRKIIIVSALGIAYYFIFATPSQRIYLDNFAKTVSFSDLPTIDSSGLSKLTENTKDFIEEKTNP